MKILFAIIFSLALIIPVCGLVEASDELVVADFDSGVKPNNVGGNFGAWDRDPMDFTQTAVESFSTNTRSGRGFSMRIDYDVDSPNPAYNGFWMKLNGINVTEYNKLSFYVKGDKERGFTPLFKVELKNDDREVGSYYVTGITDEWQKIEIPLLRVAGISSFESMDEFVIVFEDWRVPEKEGTIYIDDIKFIK